MRITPIIVLMWLSLILSGCAVTPEQTVTSQVAEAEELAPAVDFSGSWKNQRDSVMVLEQADDGSISGEYTTLVGGPGGQPFTRPVVGQSHGDQVVFYVDWSPHSMTAWVGQLLSDFEGNELLETMWINTLDIEEDNEANDGWSGVRNGGDAFERLDS